MNTVQANISYNLEQWNKLDRYSEWIFHTFENYLGETIWDIGAGVGNMSKLMLNKQKKVIATDLFDNQIEIMKSRFQKYEKFDSFLFDLNSDHWEEMNKFKFDTIVCINVLEHIEDDFHMIRKMKETISEGGYIIIFVPANPKLFCQFDKNVGHYRRYTKQRFADLAKENQLEIVKNDYFNFLGMIPYKLKSKFAKDEKTNSFSTEMKSGKLYNTATKVLEPLERVIHPPMGISEIVILKK